MTNTSRRSLTAALLAGLLLSATAFGQAKAPLLLKKQLGDYMHGTATSATAAAALVFTITGLTTSHICNYTVKSLGTGPNYAKSYAVTANTLTVTVDTAQSSGSTVITYACFVP